MATIKNPTTYNEQIALLKSRGCIIEDENFCLEILASINYYRLSAYFLPFKNSDDTFKTNTTFERIIGIYQFDKELRSLLFSTIEDIEIYLRSRFAYFHSHKYGSIGYLNPETFSSLHDKDKFSKLLKSEIHNNKNTLFVKHHLKKYDGKFPLWVATELFTFGMLSYFYADLTTQDQKELARDLYQTVPQNIESYLRCVTDLRNICAHYGRLYFRIFSAIPANINVGKNAERRLWGNIQAIKNLYPDTQKWNTVIIKKLVKLFDEYKQDIDLFHIAFPENWKELLSK